MACMTASALLLVLLVSGVLIYLSNFLEKEAELAAYVLPTLKLAHQYSSATAGMQSQGQLLRSASTVDDLIAREQLLQDSIGETRMLLKAGSSQQGIDSSALTNTIDQIHVVLIALFGIREKQLYEAQQIQLETDVTIAELDKMLDAIRTHAVDLVDRPENVQKVSSADKNILADRNIVTGADEGLESHPAKPREFESNSLNIQQYLLINQDMEKFKSLIQRLPLLRTDDAITVSMQERDLLVQTMSQRADQMQDDEVQDLLLLPLSEIDSRLTARNNLFDSALSLIELSVYQERLSTALTALTDEVPAVAEQIRTQSESVLVNVFEETRTGLEGYRWVMTGGLGIALLMLGSVSYLLVYRQTVLPLGQISGQLDSVGTDSFTSSNQSYFIQELSDLSFAVDDLDNAYKEMQRKDVQLKATNRELRRANIDLEQFAHVASHDLQEPLRKLQQFSELLEEECHNELNADGKYYIKAIWNASRRMSNMIRDTLQYASSSQANQDIINVDLEQILELVINDKQIVINETGSTIAVGNLPCVIANATGMTQLFGNLLVNAIKYRREGVPSQITIDAHYSSTVPVVDITVKDNGVGIESKYLERIFTPFERLATNSVSGTGLGLAICAKVCESHDWTIDVSSEVGVGSCFRIGVPLSQVVRKAA